MRILFTLSLSLLFCGLLSAQATRITDLSPGGEDASPNNFFNFQGNLLFRASAPDTGSELYISDGTAEGTRLLKDINDDPSVSRGNSFADNFTLFNGRLYFKARNATSGDELFVTDGTTEGTVLVDDINPGSTGSNPFDFIILNEELYFTARDADLSSELHRYDAMGDSAVVVIDINPGSGPGNPLNKTIFDGRIFFNGNDGTSGQELWASDGFDAGTFRIADIKPDGNGNSGPSQFAVHDGALFFRADTDEFGRELYKTDGISVERITDLVPGPDNGDPANLISFGGKLFFSGKTEANGTELYVSDGTTAGTMLLELNEGPDDSSPGNFQILDGPGDDDVLLFVAEDETAEQLFFLTFDNDDIEIESFDGLYGTEESLPSEPEDVVFTGSTLYFSATTPENGRELYKISVAVDEGFERITDIGAGAEDSGIDEITLIGDRLYFEAEDTSGKELWTLVAERAGYDLVAGAQGRINSGDTINMGTVVVGSDLVTVDFTIASTGTAATSADIENLEDIGDPFAVLPIGNLDSIAPGTGAVVQVGFLPVTAGTFVDEIQIFIFGPNGPERITVYIKGVGDAPRGVLEVSIGGSVIMGIDEINYGEVPSRTDSTIAVVLSNSGNGPLLYSPSLSTGVEFMADDLTPTQIPAGGSDTVRVTFAPTTEGAYSDTLNLALDLNAETMAEARFILIGNAIVNSVNNFGIDAVRTFPNPTADLLRIELSEGLINGTVRVFDLNGRSMLQEYWPANAKAHQVSIGALPAGAYTVEVSNGAGRMLVEVIKR